MGNSNDKDVIRMLENGKDRLLAEIQKLTAALEAENASLKQENANLKRENARLKGELDKCKIIEEKK